LAGFLLKGSYPEKGFTTKHIDDNWGWVKINLEEDLPGANGYCWIIGENGLIEPVFFRKYA